jgi:hypothetical protein
MQGLTRRVLSVSFLLAGAFVAACSDDDGGTTTPTPSVPSGVTATAQSATEIRVTWTAVSGATGYVVQRAEGTGAFAQVGTPSETTFDDDGLTANTAYRYRVAATNASGTSAFSSDATATTPTGEAEIVEVTANITQSTTWTKNKVYVLRGFIKVANGATLTIEAGTVIKGDFGTLGSSLFVLRGARIMANGTAAEPIVFTSSRNPGERQPGDWGGLIIVGNARINRGQPVILEGTGTDPNANPGVDYSGGTNDFDNSGTLRYVRVEFAGYATAPDAELNAFTLAAVGSGTTAEYLQAVAGLDDHFELFGGQLDLKYLVSYDAGDDHFDMSEGYQGRIQFAIAYQSKVLTPRAQAGNVSSDPQGIENDGCAGANCLNGEESIPYTLPLVANFTLVGRGAAPNATSGIGMVLRRGTAGYYINGHVTRWPNGGIALRNSSAVLTSQQARIDDGTLLLRNILVSDGAAVLETGSNRLVVPLGDPNNLVLSAATTTASAFAAFSADPGTAGDLDWSPSASAPQRTGGTGALSGAIGAKAGSFIVGTSYRGAVDPNGPKWWEGWTVYFDN